MPFVTEGSLDAQSNLIDKFLAGEKRIAELERQLEAMTAERDLYKARWEQIR
jgi:hypothetical protein